MKKLLPDFKAAWLIALRSGDIPQAHNVLKSSYGMCCLGVACDVQNKANPNFWQRYGVTPDFVTANGNISYPGPGDVDIHTYEVFQQEFHPDGFNQPIPVASFLATHNDGDNSDKWSFEEIAQWIEENL